MPALIKYALLFVADLTIIGVLVHYFLATLHWYALPFKKFDFDSYTRLKKLKTYFYFAVVYVGTGLALYGAFSFLFSWMPHRWGIDNEGEWTTISSSLSVIGL